MNEWTKQNATASSLQCACVVVTSCGSYSEKRVTRFLYTCISIIHQFPFAVNCINAEC